MSANQAARAASIVAFAVFLVLATVGFALTRTARAASNGDRAKQARQQIASWLEPIEEFRTDNGSYRGMTIALLERYDNYTYLGNARLRYVTTNGYCIERTTPPYQSRAGSTAPIRPGRCAPPLPSRQQQTNSPSPTLPDSPEILPYPLPRWASGPLYGAWMIAQATRPAMHAYFLEHHGTYRGASTTSLLDTYGATYALGFGSQVKVMTADSDSYCAAVTYKAATVFLRGAGGTTSLTPCPT